MSLSYKLLNTPLEKLSSGDFCYFSYGDIYRIETIKYIDNGSGWVCPYEIKFVGIDGTGRYCGDTGEVSSASIKKLYRDILKVEINA